MARGGLCASCGTPKTNRGVDGRQCCNHAAHDEVPVVVRFSLSELVMMHSPKEIGPD
jgi:hypothetical protein